MHLVYCLSLCVSNLSAWMTKLFLFSRPWPVIGRTIFFTSDKNRPTNQKPAITHRDEIYFIDFWRENLSMYRIRAGSLYSSSGVRRAALMALACSLKGSSENPSMLIWLAKSLFHPTTFSCFLVLDL